MFYERLHHRSLRLCKVIHEASGPFDLRRGVRQGSQKSFTVCLSATFRQLDCPKTEPKLAANTSLIIDSQTILFSLPLTVFEGLQSYSYIATLTAMTISGVFMLP